MRYSEEEVAHVHRLFTTPIQPGLYLTNCSFCGEFVVDVHRYVNEPPEAAMHHDCFVVTILTGCLKFDHLPHSIKLKMLCQQLF